ncbi:enoyl-hydratase [Hypoxylon fragiforme]|uniref:enoyl-hydratase n=1 Tax=Hypoxylon fragiforme TaxID=63214 RepID=UPI0020C68237|nr:enoyl-hydratase [Hypoxylon fragiforme]KAI2607149.1 enoyl-hydratase [Hypoxylon fragiforme]
MSSPNTSTFTTPPPDVLHTLISFPSPHILLVTLNRPKQLNAIPRPQHFALERLWDWYDAEPSLRCAVFTGAGRAFCAGADLKEWNSVNSSSTSTSTSSSSSSLSSAQEARFPRGGFGGMSNRPGKKLIIAAVHGTCFGGGMEMALNCDMVIAAATAKFALPEVTIGVIALAGALPRLVRTVGRQRAAEMALAGKAYAAKEMQGWGVVNEVVEKEGDVLEAALNWARRIAANSPDAVVVSREGLKLGWEGVGPEQCTDLLIRGWYPRIETGQNAVEGVKSFVERRKPVWVDSKL